VSALKAMFEANAKKAEESKQLLANRKPAG